MTEPAAESLSEVLKRHAIDLPDDQIEHLDHYCRALWEWNEKINLTRHTTYEKFVARDVIDSMALESFLDSGERIMDVGTGGGVPGIVLAIVRPDLKVTLAESVGKKSKAVEDIVRQLGLKVPVVAGRAESILDTKQFDTLVVRAVAPLTKLLTWFAPHWDSFHQLLIIKGPAWVEERGDARHRGLMNDLQLRKIAEYPMHGTDSMSVILQVKRPETE